MSPKDKKVGLTRPEFPPLENHEFILDYNYLIISYITLMKIRSDGSIINNPRI